MPPNLKRTRKKIAAGPSDLKPGERRLVDIQGKTIGIFNVGGRYFALHNRCPHMGGNLCQGPVTGTAVSTPDQNFEYSQSGEIIRCAWHGWEFEIKTGRSLIDERLRARSYTVTVEDGQIVLHI